MTIITPNKQIKTTLNEKYRQFLLGGPKAISKLSNPYNLLDDLNSTDKNMIKGLKAYMRNQKHAP